VAAAAPYQAGLLGLAPQRVAVLFG
jgi:hypothetical protein